MYAPLPPQYKTTSHLLHFLMCFPTFGFWAIVWGVAHSLTRSHNTAEDVRFQQQMAQGAAVYDAQRRAHEVWLYRQHAWLAGEVRRWGNPPPSVRPTFVVDGNPGQPPSRPINTGPTPRPTPRPSPVQRPVLRTPDQEPKGRHSTEVVGTSVMRRANPT